MWLINQFGSLLNLGLCKEYPIMARAKTTGNGNTRRKQVATLPAVDLTKSTKNSPSTDLEVEIRRRAYELYEQRGYTPGHENEDWLVAEQEVLSRHDQQQSA
jgi:Protein of unknown function (DUF2934)